MILLMWIQACSLHLARLDFLFMAARNTSEHTSVAVDAASQRSNGTVVTHRSACLPWCVVLCIGFDAGVHLSLPSFPKPWPWSDSVVSLETQLNSQLSLSKAFSDLRV